MVSSPFLQEIAWARSPTCWSQGRTEPSLTLNPTIQGVDTSPFPSKDTAAPWKLFRKSQWSGLLLLQPWEETELWRGLGREKKSSRSFPNQIPPSLQRRLEEEWDHTYKLLCLPGRRITCRWWARPPQSQGLCCVQIQKPGPVGMSSACHSTHGLSKAPVPYGCECIFLPK